MRTIILTACVSLLLVSGLCAGGDGALFKDLVQVARTEVKLGMFSQAARSYEDALSLPVKKDDKLDVYYELAALCSDDLADTAGAVSAYLMIADLFEGRDAVDEALYRTAWLLENLGQCHNAVDYYEKLIVDYPKSRYRGEALEGSERCFQKNFKDVAAVVRGQPITVIELESEIDRLPEVYKTRYSTPEGKAEYLDKMIRDRIVEYYARENGYMDDPEVVSKVHDATMRILNEHFFLSEVRGKVKVTDDEVHDYYMAHRKEYVKPEEVRVRHILVETEEEARNILADLKAGKKFEDLAKDYSIDMRTNEKGGDLGFITRGRTVKEIEDVAFSLEPGEISDVVKSRFGYHIVKVEEKRPESIRPLEEMRELVVSEVRRLAEEKRSKELMADLRRTYGVRVFMNEAGVPADSTAGGAALH